MKRTWRSYTEAKAFVHALQLENQQAWREYCRSGQRPVDIPSDPRRVYHKEFESMGNWLGTNTVASRQRTYQPFPEARTFVQALGLQTEEEWIAYCQSGNKPDAIPAAPRHVYGSAFVSLGDWLGTGRVAFYKRSYRSFEEARAYARTLHLKGNEEWKAYCRSGQKPNDIPFNPDRRYKPDFKSWGDWLGTGNIANYNRVYRSFSEARTFVQSLNLKNGRQWKTYCQSGNKPDDIPASPHQVYASEFISMGNWLGTGAVANYNRVYRSFSEARTFVQSLKLKNEQQWKTYCQSGNRPDDIPANPYQVYASEFINLGDWLGTGTIASFHRVYRDFATARAFTRALGLKNQQEWRAYCRSGQKPSDIPTNPHRTYHTEFRGISDWLGTTTTWNRAALLALLEDLRSHLRFLHERELYVILQAGGALPALRIALGEPTQTVIQRVLTQEEQVRQKIQTMKNDAGAIEMQKGETNNHEEDVPEIPEILDEGLLNTVLDAPSQQNIAMDLESPSVMHAYRQEQLHLVDHLTHLSNGLDDEVAEYLIASRVNFLWEVYSHEGQQALDDLFGEGEGGQFFLEIKRRFLAEVEAVERLDWREGWAFTIHGKHAEPNVMQRRIAWLVRENQRVGNWSGVGSGKTLSALLSSRISQSHLTLILTNYPTISGWLQSIRNVYPDSDVSTDLQGILASDPSHYRYLVLNYEQFQNAGRHHLVQQLLKLGIQFIVLDEIQLVKQREAKMSQRSQAVQTLIKQANLRNPDLHVLGMSATPIINSLLEGKRLLEMTIGTSFPELGTSPTVANALAMHRALMRYGFRFRPRYEQEMHIRHITVKRNDLLPHLERAQSSILAMEQSVLPAKLNAIEPYLQPGTLLYTHYIEGMLPLIQQHLAHLGFSMGLYTGSDKSGLQRFLENQVEILVGSSAVGTGLDGLQQRCHQIILLSLPWTGAAFEQIIGRAHRQGSQFQRIEIVIPQVTLEEKGERWSWDVQRWNMVQSKRTLSDCVLDGRIPDTIRLDKQALLHQSSVALQRWIEQVRDGNSSALTTPSTIIS